MGGTAPRFGKALKFNLNRKETWRRTAFRIIKRKKKLTKTHAERRRTIFHTLLGTNTDICKACFPMVFKELLAPLI